MKFFHGTTERAADCIEKEGFLGSELSTDTSGFSHKYNADGVVFLAKDLELAQEYGEAIIEVEIDESRVKPFQLCPVTGKQEYYATMQDMEEDASWWRR